jgi:anthranilate phosphoribosyltransferase
MKRDQGPFLSTATDMPRFDAGSLLRRIGRGAQGSRDLQREESEALFDALFSGQLSEAAIGAVLIALRVKGESADELLGALDATQRFINPVPTHSDLPVVSIPSYNGARHLPNLTWLLAMLLAREGLQVIVHGTAQENRATIEEDGRRTHTESIVRAFDQTAEHDCFIGAEHALGQFARQLPVYVPLQCLCPELMNLIERRVELGVRNVGHSLAKLLNPTQRRDCLRITAYTHPEFETLQHEVFARLREPAMILRATEGEVVANVRKPAAMDLVYRSTTLEVTQGQARSLSVTTMPDLPERSDIEATVRYTVDVLSGTKPVPAPIAAQVEAITHAARLPT